jgi:uncharacterized protein (TIGR03067 family)
MRCALLALALLAMAFAPAPFPRPQRDRTAIDLARFQGTWKVVGHHTWSAAQKQPSPWNITHVRVQKDRWTLLEGIKEVVSYRIELHPKNKPCHIDWRGARGEALWLGLIRRDGDSVEVIYLSSSQRPENFETPQNGSHLISLRRSAGAASGAPPGRRP